MYYAFGPLMPPLTVANAHMIMIMYTYIMYLYIFKPHVHMYMHVYLLAWFPGLSASFGGHVK